ncbi:ACP S-malonyltransferase [Hyphococcus sp.]|uniref:ACP S-malonyltransferase n=1 Tax=Hyphococcus sp. TaxID=2038636 RepID=UPI003CCC14F2
MKKSAVVIFPGRGAYGKDELGYLSRYHTEKEDFITDVDKWRKTNGRETVTALDSAKAYSAAKHASSINASPLIYACALCDFAAINREKFDIVAVCGNSLGWYLTLAAAGAANRENAIRIIDTMGSLMQAEGIGGQLIYPFVDENWISSEANRKRIGEALHAGRTAGAAYLSIRLGGMAILAGDDAGMTAMEKTLPQAEGRYPFRLARHAAFHTPLLEHISQKALGLFDQNIMQEPEIPMIDGRGAIWSRYNINLQALYQYTFGHQIVETYDFSKSIEVAIKEFAPDQLILAGPGATLGAAIAQELIQHEWLGLKEKADFSAMQKENPYLIAMGREDQRKRAI